MYEVAVNKRELEFSENLTIALFITFDAICQSNCGGQSGAITLHLDYKFVKFVKIDGIHT